MKNHKTAQAATNAINRLATFAPKPEPLDFMVARHTIEEYIEGSEQFKIASLTDEQAATIGKVAEDAGWKMPREATEEQLHSVVGRAVINAILAIPIDFQP